MNIMMDPSRIYPESFHPQATRMDPTNKRHAKQGSRTKTPVKYFLIDFGISVKFSPDDKNPSALPIRGGDKSVPEMQDCTGPLNPFPTDVYYLGNMIREDILRVISFHKTLHRMSDRENTNTPGYLWCRIHDSAHE